MSLNGKVVVVIGATGVVGSGICRAFLDAGAFVVGVSRSAEKFDELEKTLGLTTSDAFATAVGDFKDEASSGLAMAAIDRAPTRARRLPPPRRRSARTSTALPAPGRLGRSSTPSPGRV
jgi:NAD(P)-dependent dehydrogenase (short-subunit alcohol dehydrogenase family)